MDEETKNWKLKLRYGKLTTAFKHLTTITEGIVAEDSPYAPDTAFMRMKLWALDYSQAAELVASVVEHVRFTIAGEIELFATDPQEPPQQEPYGYDVGFTYFQE